jgi:hypothetical protein
MENINGGFPPIKIIKFKKEEKKKEFSKERGFSNNINNVNIQNIIRSKKKNIISKKKEEIEIIESL